ncbi:MAG: PDZ domain-containing protein [Planctomycetota bacterium]
MIRALTICVLLAVASPALARDMNEDATLLGAIHDRLRHSIVQIGTVVRDELPSGASLDTERESVGMVVSADGLILGPWSVVEGAGTGESRVASVTIYLEGARRFEASYLGPDRESETAFFQVDDPEFDARPIEFDDSDELRVGEFIASAKLSGPNFGRVAYLDAFLVSGAVKEPARCYLTTFAVSDYLGGPVATMDGRVVGMVGWMRFRSGPPAGKSIFASVFGSADDGREVVLVPVSRLRQALENPPASGPAEDQTRPAWLGVQTQPLLPEISRALGLSEDLRGVLVTRVLPGSPADLCGLRVGDLVHKVGGKLFEQGSNREEQFLRESVARTAPGERLLLSVLRNGEELPLAAPLSAVPLSPDEAERSDSTVFGIGARDLVVADRADQHLSSGFDGALLTRVNRTGIGGLGGLQVGDIVTEVNGAPIAGGKALCQRLDQATNDRESELVLLVVRGRETRFVHLKQDRQPRAGPDLGSR